MFSLRLCCAVCVVVATSAAADVAAQAYAQQGYDQQQYPQQQYQQYPQQQPAQGADMQQQQQPPPGYFPTPDAQGSYGYQQGYAPNGAYPAQQQAPGYGPGEPAQEQVVSSFKGIQLGAGIALMQISSLSVSQSSMPAAATTTPAMGMAAAAQAAPTAQQQLFGKYDKHPFTLEGGYGISDKLLIGVILQLASASEKLEANGGNATVSDFTFTFAPKLDYSLSTSSRWNPFIGAALSVTLHSRELGPFKDSHTLFGVAGRVGMRAFVLDQLSIDPVLMLGYSFGSGTQKQALVPQPAEFENSLSGPLVAISMGVSLWIK